MSGQGIANQVILSVFPGVDLLGRWFSEVFPEACLVRGPDLIFGGDIRQFHPPAGVFWGVIGGPPCQMFSRLRYLNPLAGAKHGNLIPEFERVVMEAQPTWFLMENVPPAPEPVVAGYIVRSLVLNNRWVGESGIGGEQQRQRRFSFGTHDGRRLVVDVALFEAQSVEFAVTHSAQRVPVKLQRDGHGGHQVKRTLAAPTVLAGHGPIGRGQGYQTTLPIGEACRLQGLPPDFLEDAPFTAEGRRRVIGNGVPRELGIAVARAVRRAMEG